MTRPRPLLPLLPVLVACLSAPVEEPATPGPDARQVLWQRSLDDAQAVARATGRPLLLAVNMDGESASDRIVREEYRDPAFVAATRGCVCLVASVFRHTPVDHDDQGRRIPCPRLGEVTCGEHIALEPALFEALLADGERVAPRHALVLPDGGKAWDLSLSFDLQDIDRALFASVEGLESAPTPRIEPRTWADLAAARDHRGRTALEDALARIADETTLTDALDALRDHGDAGALDALRVVAGRAPSRSDGSRARLVATARALDLAAPLALALRGSLATPGALPDQPDPGDTPVLLPVLAELDGASPPTRSLLLACRALDAYGDEAERALRIALGPDEAARVAEALATHGGALSLDEVLARAAAVTRTARDGTLPEIGGITDALPAADDLEGDLEGELEALDRERRERGDDAALAARAAKAALDLARRRMEAGKSGAQLLLEDAERGFADALEREPDHAAWWIERARAAYFRGRYEEEVEFGRRARALCGPPAEDPTAAEALRWIGDGHARLLGARSGGDPAVELAGIVEGVHALGTVAASRWGDAADWTSFATFLGALGLAREQFAITLRAAERLPAAPNLRQLQNGALWSAGRVVLVPALAERLAAEHPESPDALWHAGYAWILSAEDHRRAEQCALAVRDYTRARARFAQTAALRPDWRASCDGYVALCWLGEGLALVRLGRRAEAAQRLVAAASVGVPLADARDGLGYDVLDLCDKVLEWRADGPSPVDPLALLDELEAAAPGTPFWAAAVSDSELREALRADGRNPVRAERDTVDAAGNPIRQVMGLPCPEGDPYLAASIVAGRRALALAATPEDRTPLAQSATIRAERQLELGRLEGVRDALAEAAAVLGFAPPSADADEAALRQLAGRLRATLGDARPRWRAGR